MAGTSPAMTLWVLSVPSPMMPPIACEERKKMALPQPHQHATGLMTNPTA
ncbi:hypothetical protein ABIA03_003161 [Bradyrhizobium yuanmingense]|uniref:Uncharacterized protein n=1 Tax=Bradyrhizobium yuanmingense TaxID=108015 RepID=A0ABV4GHN1_9BRAD